MKSETMAEVIAAHIEARDGYDVEYPPSIRLLAHNLAGALQAAGFGATK